MTTRRCLVLAAVIALLGAAAAGSTAVLVAVITLTGAAAAVAAPIQPGTYRRRSTTPATASTDRGE